MIADNVYKFFIVLGLFILLDAPYLALSRQFYLNVVKNISGHLNFTTRYIGAFMVYVWLALGFMVLVYQPALTLYNIILRGALFGLVVYGVFNFTNNFLFMGWSLDVALRDTAWGTILGGLVGLSFHRLMKITG